MTRQERKLHQNYVQRERERLREKERERLREREKEEENSLRGSKAYVMEFW